MAQKYLDSNGLAYFWQKIKAYGDAHWGGGSASGTSVPTADTIAEFDSTAHMNSTDMTASEVSDFVDSLEGQGANLADYVIEEGTVVDTNGEVHYRKWNKGILEISTCLNNFTLTNYAGAYNGWYPYYYTFDFGSYFPASTFVNTNYTVTHAWSIGSGYASAGTVLEKTTSSVKLFAIGSSSGTQSVCINVELKGRWK